MVIEKYKGGVFPKNEFTLTDIIKEVKRGTDISQSGAILTFTGVVRNTSIKSNKLVSNIEIESWDERAFAEMENICLELIEKYNLIDVRIWHAVGTFEVSEDLVYIVIATQHRKNGFLAMEEAINLYKMRVPIWKKEIYVDGEQKWISESQVEPLK